MESRQKQNGILLIIYVGGRFMQKYGAYLIMCVLYLLRSTNMAMSCLANCFHYAWTAESNIQHLVVYTKIQKARDEIGTNFCINLDNNINNEFSCFVSKPPNHIQYNSIYYAFTEYKPNSPSLCLLALDPKGLHISTSSKYKIIWSALGFFENNGWFA